MLQSIRFSEQGKPKLLWLEQASRLIRTTLIFSLWLRKGGAGFTVRPGQPNKEGELICKLPQRTGAIRSSFFNDLINKLRVYQTGFDSQGDHLKVRTSFEFSTQPG
jgi:hypothetical protein